MRKLIILPFLMALCLSSCQRSDTTYVSTTSEAPTVTQPNITKAPGEPAAPSTTKAPDRASAPAPTKAPDVPAVPDSTENPEAVTTVPTYSPEDYYKENEHVRIQLYLTQADVTHDGVEDYIETCMYFLPETDLSIDMEGTIQGRLDVADAIVSVYDGRSATTNNLGTPIWAKGYSACHAGNGQVSLVYKDGLAYLLEGCLWQGQGFTGYEHSVIFFEETGTQKTLAEHSLQFYETDYSREEQIQLIISFKEQLEPWFEDALLIVATDVSLDKQFISTSEKAYSPQDYYDTVWSQWSQ